MHMFGAMYAPTDWLTLMAMGMYVEEGPWTTSTFRGMSGGTGVLGRFTTTSKGFANTKLSGLIKLYDDGAHKLHLNAGISLPTGEVKNEDDRSHTHEYAP